MTKPKSRILALIQTVALVRCLAKEITGLLIEITELLIAFAGLIVAAAAMIRHWL